MSELFEKAIRGKAVAKAKSIVSTLPPRVIDLYRNTQKLPQAILKVSSYSKTQSRALAHADYITRHSKDEDNLPVEMSDGSVLTEHDEVQEVIESWYAEENVRHNSRRSLNMILSSPADSNIDRLKSSVRDFVGEYFQGHESMFVIHTDTNNPHAHLSVRTRNSLGAQLRLGPSELKDMKDMYAEKLRDNGIQVQSSYRSDRGELKRGVTQAVHHMHKNHVACQRESPFSDKPLQDDHPSKTSFERCLQRTQNEYLGAALFLRKVYGLELEREAHDLEHFGQGLTESRKNSIRLKEQKQENDFDRE